MHFTEKVAVKVKKIITKHNVDANHADDLPASTNPFSYTNFQPVQNIRFINSSIKK